MKDNWFLVSATGGFLANILLWIVILSKVGYSQTNVALHYNIVYGIDLVGKAVNLYLIPATGFVLYLANLYLAAILRDKAKFLSQLLTFSSLAVQFFLLLALIALLKLNA